MSSINPLGFRVNFGRNANGGTNRVQLRDYSGMGFVVDTPGNASTITVTEANASSGGTSQALNGGAAGAIPSYYTQTNGVWTLVTTGISANVITISGTPDLAYVWVPQGALSDTFNYVQFVHSAKVGLYAACELDVGRKPANLRNLYA